MIRYGLLAGAALTATGAAHAQTTPLALAAPRMGAVSIGAQATPPSGAPVQSASRAACSTQPAYGVLPLQDGGVGYIRDAQGHIFVPRGVGVMEGQEASASSLQSLFPGINFVRYAIYDYRSPEQLAAYVNSLTSAGIIVELEDHSNSTGGNAGGSQGVIFTGARLQQELSWYASIASYFASDPDVWLGTDNEPSDVNPSTGQADPSALSDWQLATYDAIRGIKNGSNPASTGNNNPIMLELNGYADPSSMGQGYNAADYTGMYNVIWDMHIYGWLTNYNTDQATNNSFVSAAVKQAETFTSSGGVKIPVLIGEYGNSTTGTNIDRNGTQIVNAVHSAVTTGTAAGSAAWAYSPGNPGDGLLQGGSLSSYGQQVATYLGRPVSTAAAAEAVSTCSGSPQTVASAGTRAESVTVTTPMPASGPTPTPTPASTPASSASESATIAAADADASAQQQQSAADAVVNQANAILSRIPTQ